MDPQSNPTRPTFIDLWAAKIGWPIATLEIDGATLDRFWRKVQKMDQDCWLWIGAKAGGGHGRFKLDGALVSPHRFMYELIFGPIPEGMLVCHDCPGGDNPACVNPAHLFLGTPRDNIMDALRKGQRPVKLKKEQVRQIKQLLEAGEFSQERLASLFGVSDTTIYEIAHQKGRFQAIL